VPNNSAEQFDGKAGFLGSKNNSHRAWVFRFSLRLRGRNCACEAEAMFFIWIHTALFLRPFDRRASQHVSRGCRIGAGQVTVKIPSSCSCRKSPSPRSYLQDQFGAHGARVAGLHQPNFIKQRWRLSL
jgi:hypothetical protein